MNYFHNKVLESNRGAANSTEPALMKYSPQLKLFDLGYDQVLADIYWLAFVQYVGDSQARRIDRYDGAKNFLDTIISLDPQFTEAHYFAAFIIGSERNEPNVAAAIIEKGIAANPSSWYIPFIAGINQFLYAHNDVKAAFYYQMAARVPGSPKWLPQQARILEAKIPTIIKEINIWNNIFDSAEDGPVKDRARAKLVQLWTDVLRTAPTETIKDRARQQLRRMDQSMPAI